ncbi:hypothetical protein [Pseudomonas putida]|uniref:hypothetical protein n=1 Tax=Pseudomonas putida TaxID=303 RepID=UPI00235CE6DC|nr:hypothetical protein [Pseudomonas putida]GLO24401.1 hypothetical protein PPUJ21368_22290 [Pseudomonas putida]HDS0969209.1 hypothetical protein [Pseudomonas putida]
MDTNKMRDISRDQFEAWIRKEYQLDASDDINFANGEVRMMLKGWQASREAVAVEIEQIRSEAKRQEDGLKEMLRRQNKQICALRGKS